MEPLKRELTWRRNAPAPTGFTLMVDGAPFDLTGYTFKLQIRTYPGATGAALITLDMADEGEPGFFIDDAAAGKFTMTPPLTADLNALPAPADPTTGRNDSLSYDILMIAADGQPEVFAEGPVVLLSGVTRA